MPGYHQYHPPCPQVYFQIIEAISKMRLLLISVRPQMVDFGSEQGLSNFETDSEAVTAIAGIAGYVERA
jgi:hypothetical protein